jgi:hypothetical protein
MLNAQILYYERDPDALVLSAESPTFALYDDGTVIYQARPSAFGQLLASQNSLESKNKAQTANKIIAPTQTPFRSVRIKENERKEWLNRMSSLGDLGERYDAPELSCHASVFTLLVNTPDVQKEFVVRGSHLRAPAKLALVLKLMSSFRHQKSEPWVPERIEVMLWPFEHARLPSIEWPSGWPDCTDSKYSLNTGPNLLSDYAPGPESDCYSIFLPMTYLEELQELKAKSGLAAVLVSGKKCSLEYRFPFPHERTEVTPEYQKQVTTAAEKQRQWSEQLQEQASARFKKNEPSDSGPPP